MRATVTGKVVSVEERSYTDRNGVTQHGFDAYMAADDPKYAPDRISGPMDLMPKVGAQVSFICQFRAMQGKRGPWLSVYAVAVS